jgi:hypothetical protein
MRAPRWGEPSGTVTASVDVVLLLQWTECATNLSALRHQSADVLSLEAAVGSSRFDHARGTLAPPAQGAPAHVDGGTRRTRFVPAPTISALGQRQASRAPATRAPPCLHFDGRQHLGRSGVGRCTNRRKRPCCGRRDASCETVPGPFSCLNIGESSSPEIWCRSTPRRFACVAASS